MSLKENSETYKSLPVELNSKWSTNLPKVVWRGFDLTPKNTSDPALLDLSELSLAQSLEAIHTELEYLNFLKVCLYLEESLDEAAQEIGSLEEHFHFRWGGEARELLQQWLRLPEEFKSWSLEKKLKFNDLRPLMRARLNLISPYLEKLPLTQASKSIGTELLERLCDLRAEDYETATDLLSRPEASFWLERLKKLSLPMTSEKDLKRMERVKSWPWPSRMKGEWKRQGDQAGLFVEFYSTNPADFEKKIKDLNQFCERWKSEL